MYKIGDKVIIRSKFLPGTGPDDYRGTFLPEMMDSYGGIIGTISECWTSALNDTMLPDDGYFYHLYEDNEEWCWASSMFEC